MVFEKVAQILAEIMDCDSEDIGPETELTVDYGSNAIDIAKLVIECEKKFKITIYDEDVYTFRTVSDVVEYVEKMRSGRS